MNSRTAECADCGQSFSVESSVGPLPARCPEHTREYKRKANVERGARKRQRQATGGAVREVHCVDCSERLPWDGRGRPKLRCEGCLTAHNLAMSRVRYASSVATDPELARERWRRGYRRNAERIRAQKLDAHYRKRYGLTTVEVEQLREARSGLCEICGRPPNGGGSSARLHVDHCHNSGRVRGLLCGNCNTMIGLAAEDPQILLAAVEYLQKEQVNANH